METQTPFIIKAFGALTAAIGSAFGLGKYNSTLVKKNEVYNKDGSLIYMRSEDAKACRDEFSKAVQAVIKDSKEQNEKLIEYIKEKATADNLRHEKMMEFVGSVKTYMEMNKPRNS